jgi:hypothetical protein
MLWTPAPDYRACRGQRHGGRRRVVIETSQLSTASPAEPLRPRLRTNNNVGH